MALFEPRLSPVVIGISWPITKFAGSLSIAITVCVERISEFWSSATALMMPAKLSPPLRSPNPETKPEDCKSEEDATLLKVAFSPSSISDPAKATKSGFDPFWNLVIPTGTLPS